MPPETLLALLGRPSADPDVDRVLTQFKLKRRPAVELEEDEDGDVEVLNTQDWLTNRARGIEFGFEDQASFTGGDTDEQGKGPMLLTQLYFYGEHPEIQPYTVDSLPFGVRLDDDRATVRRRLTAFEPTRRSWVRDVWETPDCILTVNYASDGARVGFVLCSLRVPPSPGFDDVRHVPDIDQLLAVLGRHMDDEGVRKAVRPLRVKASLQEMGETLIALLRYEFGIDLHFGGVPRLDPTVFGNFYLYRDREDDACGWPGKLPRKLTWNDSPELLFQKLGAPNEPPSEDDFVGHALWHFPEYSLQVQYSTMYNWIESLRILAPGVWGAY